MKVHELQERLSELDSGLELVFYCEDEGLLEEGRGFVLFDLVGTQKANAEFVRLKGEIPYLKLGRTESSVPFAIVQITSDF